MKKLNFLRWFASTRRVYRLVWQRRSYWLRLTLAWAIAASFAYFNQSINTDNRFALRPAQTISNNIVLLEIDSQYWHDRLKKNSDEFILKEPDPSQDRFYWHEPTWNTILKKLLANNPQKIGVAIHFDEQITPPSSDIRQNPLFRSPKIIWGSKKDNEGKIRPSYFAGSFTKNSGLINIQYDSDGLARRFSDNKSDAPLLAYQLANRTASKVDPKIKNLINFRGPPNSFPTYSLKDFLDSELPQDAFADKIVIIGPSGSADLTINTPIGALHRAEYFATLVDNIQHDRWIQSIPFLLLCFFLAIFAWLSAWIVTNYPQILASTIIIMSLFVAVATSYLLFDSFYIYLPLLSVTLSLLGTYFLFLSFRLSIKDYENIRLEQEKQLLVNVEELKSNFFSLISHDLKTPIAKIQGICDRMLANNPKEEVTNDILALKKEASELNRYIKTLLQLTRVESKEFRLNKEPLDINMNIEEVIEIVHPLAKEKNIILSTELEPMFLIEADPLLMKEVILNLIENAIKYSPEKTQVTISSKEVDGRVIVIVKDQGPGIDEAEHKYIFDKFYRGLEGKSTSKGSGLGLYLVKYFIERHDGFVLLESDKNSGTRIGFSLPVQSEKNESKDLDTNENEELNENSA